VTANLGPSKCRVGLSATSSDLNRKRVDGGVSSRKLKSAET